VEATVCPDSNIRVVLKYFDGCNSGDLDTLRSTLSPNVVHYFLSEGHKPIRGAEHLARYWRKFYLVYKPIWRVDHTLAARDEVVIEWSCSYIPRDKIDRMMFRGTEWYFMESGLIGEVRAYYQYDESRDCELTDFPYAKRNYLMTNAAPQAIGDPGLKTLASFGSDPGYTCLAFHTTGSTRFDPSDPRQSVVDSALRWAASGL